MHELQYARVTARSVEEAWTKLGDELTRFGTPSTYVRRVLWLDTSRGVVGVEPNLEDSPFADEAATPEAWQAEEQWVRAAWLSAFSSAQLGPLFQAWNPDALRQASAFHRALAAMPIDALPRHFLDVAGDELRARYATVSFPFTDDARLDSHRREALVDVFELVYRAPAERLPFLPALSPERWPAHGIDGEGVVHYLLADVHLGL